MAAMNRVEVFSDGAYLIIGSIAPGHTFHAIKDNKFSLLCRPAGSCKAKHGRPDTVLLARERDAKYIKTEDNL